MVFANFEMGSSIFEMGLSKFDMVLVNFNMGLNDLYMLLTTFIMKKWQKDYFIYNIGNFIWIYAILSTNASF